MCGGFLRSGILARGGFMSTIILKHVPRIDPYGKLTKAFWYVIRVPIVQNEETENLGLYERYLSENGINHRFLHAYGLA